jgi:hypothetical protein
MKKLLFLVILISVEKALNAQYVYTIKADSVKITNSCDTAELIIENHTQNVPGFLFNKGRGRTEFRRPLQKISDTLYLVGADSLKLGNAWLQGGNAFGTTGLLGTKDNNHIDFYTNNIYRGRWTNNGSLLIGSVADDGNKLQIGGTGAISFNSNLSRPGDRIMFGGKMHDDDGRNALIRISGDNGVTYRNILVERDGRIGLGTTNVPVDWWGLTPAVRINDDGVVSFMTHTMYFGQIPGPNNSSALITRMSNVNEMQQSTDYPNRQNTYYFGTLLSGPINSNVRAPLELGARYLHFKTGGLDTSAVIITENRNVLIGTDTDNGYKLDVNGAARFTQPNSPGAVIASANDAFDIRLIPNYENSFGSGKHSSMITFGAVKGSIAVIKQDNGTIPVNSMLIGGVSPDYWTTITDYNSNPTFTAKGNGQVIIHGGYNGISHGGSTSWAANAHAHTFNIYGARGTGSGAAGDIVISTGNTQASGNTIHPMSERWFIKGGTGYLSNTSNPTSILDISGNTGYSQLRLRTSYTPASTSDTNGSIGDVSWDDNYLYIKTTGGWKRAALSTF